MSFFGYEQFEILNNILLILQFKNKLRLQGKYRDVISLTDDVI